MPKSKLPTTSAHTYTHLKAGNAGVCVCAARDGSGRALSKAERRPTSMLSETMQCNTMKTQVCDVKHKDMCIEGKVCTFVAGAKEAIP